MSKIKNKFTGTFETSYKKQKNKIEKMALRHIKAEDIIIDPNKIISKLTITHPLNGTELKFEKKWRNKRKKTVILDCVEAEELYILLHDYYSNVDDTYKYVRK